LPPTAASIDGAGPRASSPAISAAVLLLAQAWDFAKLAN
jgi:hypothetical protein